MRRAALASLLLVAVAAPALAADAPAAKRPPRRIEKYDGPEIRWARSWQDAKDEAAERGLLVFLHSHGST
ncbi:MAG: hypothetical protein JNM10_09495 [Planctomycetia bacterium]|nr:hypothetical protein [Planctomycetia bacterium]